VLSESPLNTPDSDLFGGAMTPGAPGAEGWRSQSAPWLGICGHLCVSMT